MFSIILVAAAHLSAPQGVDVRYLVTVDDLPIEYLPVVSDRSVGIRLTVRPDGQVQSCEVEYESGVEQVDRYTCKLAKRRARFTAASADAGTPSYAVYRTTVRWVTTGFAEAGPAPNVADLTLTVNQLPVGKKSPLYLNVAFEVDQSGHASSCAIMSQPKPLTSDEQDLVKVACDQIVATYRPIPAKNEQGQPVASVQNALVGFVTK